MSKKWKKIEDEYVVTLWKPTCGCSNEVAELFPCDFAETGVPICGDCGADMEHIGTKIKV